MTSLVDALLRTASEEGTGHALPGRCYTDPAFFELEREHVLRPGWHAIARWDELPEPGDHRAVDVHGEPVLLVRGEDRRLRALSGLCLHRACPLARGDGHARRLVCPYHRWAYELDGRLASAPLMEDVPGFDRAAHRLPGIALEVWQGFVLVNPSGDAPPLAPQLEALTARLAPFGLERAVHVGVDDWDSPWNWKVMVENFMESYHHLGPHVASLGRSHPARGTCDLPTPGPCAVLENPSAEGDDAFWAIQVFPTLLFAQSRGPLPFSAWYEMRIDRPDHLHLRTHVMLPEPYASDREIARATREAVKAIHVEDIPLCEGVQRGVASRRWTPGPLSVHEAALRHFHRFLAERIGAAVGRRG